MIKNETIQNALVAPIRKIEAKVELYKNSTLADTFTYNGAIQEINIDRVGEEGKFFGFGICQKLTLKLRDKQRTIAISKGDKLKPYFGMNEEYIDNLPEFIVSEAKRDEITNALTITAYDAINDAVNYTVAELELGGSYTMREFIVACKNLLGLPKIVVTNIDKEVYERLEFPQGANFDGTETIRAALDAIGDTLQAIYYMDNRGLIFKRLSQYEAVYNVSKANYYSLEAKDIHTLSTITHITELGDNTSASADIEGVTQFVRNNPFWELREDIGFLVDDAVAKIGGVSIPSYNLQWRGNFLLELGDKISISGKNSQNIDTYLLNDSIKYNGGYSQKSSWNYTEQSEKPHSNPTSLGQALNETFAKVDKAKKEIEIVASEAAANAEKIASLQINTNAISASVSKMEQVTNEALGAVAENVAELTNRVNATITAEDVRLEIQSELANGANKVVTDTGFTFNEQGLTVSKSNSEMTTTITEDGMKVFRDNTAVLTANNVGVDAVNLHATTYLIIGTNSRFEDYGNNRTGCFWIGG